MSVPVNLNKFEDLGMQIVSMGHSNSTTDSSPTARMKLNIDDKKVFISVDTAVCEIAFGTTKGLRIVPILDYRRNRLYLVPDVSGYSFNTCGEGSHRLSFYSKPLYVELVKHKYHRLANYELLFDENLNAYYLEVE